MGNKQDIRIVPMKIEHVAEVTQLHIEGIKESFINLLGHRFVCRLYQAIIESDNAFGFVAVRNNKVLGFVSCAENTGALYKWILKKNFFKLLWAYLPRMLLPRNIKGSIETLLYPSRGGNDLPPAELLAIVVDPGARGLGLGRKFVELCCEEFRKRGIKAFKAIVDTSFKSNEFYKCVGFKPVGKYLHHGDMHNIYVAEIPG
jgi:ribosomal protein S18 acetylase RimI-like enzyme